MGLIAVAKNDIARERNPIGFRKPRAEDGNQVWQLIKESGALDENSVYCNLLQCTHFSATCSIAEFDGEIVGWVSGYIPPDEPNTLFIWQVCVSEKARGRGLAKRLLQDVLKRDACRDVDQIKSTITSDNDASWALFGSIAKAYDADMRRAPHFKKEVHFDGAHDTEHLVTIGPISRRANKIKSAA